MNTDTAVTRSHQLDDVQMKVLFAKIYTDRSQTANTQNKNPNS